MSRCQRRCHNDDELSLHSVQLRENSDTEKRGEEICVLTSSRPRSSRPRSSQTTGRDDGMGRRDVFSCFHVDVQLLRDDVLISEIRIRIFVSFVLSFLCEA